MLEDEKVNNQKEPENVTSDDLDEEEIVEDVNENGKGKIYFPKTGVIIICSIIVLMIICIIVIMCNGGPIKN